MLNPENRQKPLYCQFIPPDFSKLPMPGGGGGGKQVSSKTVMSNSFFSLFVATRYVLGGSGFEAG